MPTRWANADIHFVNRRVAGRQMILFNLGLHHDASLRHDLIHSLGDGLDFLQLNDKA